MNSRGELFAALIDPAATPEQIEALRAGRRERGFDPRRAWADFVREAPDVAKAATEALEEVRKAYPSAPAADIMRIARGRHPDLVEQLAAVALPEPVVASAAAVGIGAAAPPRQPSNADRLMTLVQGLGIQDIRLN